MEKDQEKKVEVKDKEKELTKLEYMVLDLGGLYESESYDVTFRVTPPDEKGVIDVKLIGSEKVEL